MACIACREALYSRALVAVYTAIALSPLILVYMALDARIESSSTGVEIVIVRGQEAEPIELPRAVLVESVPPNESALVVQALGEAREGLVLVTLLLFLAVASIVAFLVARPLEKGYIVFDIKVKGGKSRAIMERIGVSLGIAALALAIASVPIGAVIYIKGAEESLAGAVLSTLAWLLALALITVPAISFLSLLIKSVAGVLMASFLIAFLSLIVSINRPLSIIETYGLVWEFGVGVYDSTLYAVIVVTFLAGSYVLSTRVEA